MSQADSISDAFRRALKARSAHDGLAYTEAARRMMAELQVDNYAGSLDVVRTVEQSLRDVQAVENPNPAAVAALERLLGDAKDSVAEQTAEMTETMLADYQRFYGVARCSLMACQEAATTVAFTVANETPVTFPTCAEHFAAFPDPV